MLISVPCAPRGSGDRSEFSGKKILVSGYAPEYLYEIAKLDSGSPFAELKGRAHVNARAQAADKAADFSRRIRSGLP